MRLRKLPKGVLRRYVRDSQLVTAEVRALWRSFTVLDAGSKGFLTPEEFASSKELRCNPFATRLAAVFSEDGSGCLTFSKYLNLFAEFRSQDRKTAWMFAAWDFDGDDLIGTGDLKRGLHILFGAPARQESRAGKGEEVSEEHLTRDQLGLVLERLTMEVDPAGLGLTYTDFESLMNKLPDFADNLTLGIS